MTTDDAAFQARVNAILATLCGEVHELVTRTSAQHGAAFGSKDTLAIAAYVGAITSAMGLQLGAMAEVLGPNGPAKVMAIFRSSFAQGADQMRAEFSAAQTPN